MLLFLTMFGIITVILTFCSFNELRSSDFDNQHYIASHSQFLFKVTAFLFLGFGIFIASTLLESMRDKTDRIAYLTIPASDMEKYLSRWLIVTIGYIIFFAIALWMADAVRVTFCRYRYPEFDIRFLDYTKLLNPEKTINLNDFAFFSKDFFSFSVSLYFLLQSLFILGAAFWQKASFVKTFSAIVVIIFLFFFFNWGMVKIVHHDFESFGNQLNPFLLHHINDFSENAFFLSSSYLFIPFTLFNWIIAFFRFRESEIIKRL
jgi:hypothetical protein